MPGFHLGSAAEGTVWYLYKDFADWQAKAERTRGRADDEFVELQLLLHPDDSIEYFFPSYIMQTWDYGGHSLLGEGKHLTILQKANEIMAKYPDRFTEEINIVKNDLLQDLTAQPGGYWYDKDRLLSETDAILDAELGILTEKDLVSIRAQRKRFEEPATSNLKINLRAGGN